LAQDQFGDAAEIAKHYLETASSLSHAMLEAVDRQQRAQMAMQAQTAQLCKMLLSDEHLPPGD